MKKLFFVCLFRSFFFFLLFLQLIWSMKNVFFSFLRLRVLYFYKIIIKHIIRSIIPFFFLCQYKSFLSIRWRFTPEFSLFCFYYKLSPMCVRERKAGSGARLSLIALHAELRKQMSNITALPFYRLCVRCARTPPILFSLGVFLLLPSLIHMHSSLIFRHQSCRLLSLVVCTCM
jgi:hypothetical protein